MPRMKSLIRVGAVCLAAWMSSLSPSVAETAREAANYQPPAIPVPSLGGWPHWSDVRVEGRWRIQEHTLKGTFRLLDANNLKWASGTYRKTLAGLAYHRKKKPAEFRWQSDHLVILLHGLGRSSRGMASLGAVLRGKGFDAVAINYASTNDSLEGHAKRLESLLLNLDGVKRVTFVTHSLGGMVTRVLLARDGKWKSRIKPHGVVMLAPPSKGAHLAGKLESTTFFRVVGGPSAGQLLKSYNGNIPVPDVRYCIIAGGRGDSEGYTSIIPGDDDGIVAVEETRITPDDDFLLVHNVHTTIMNNDRAVAAVTRFLDGGKCAGRK